MTRFAINSVGRHEEISQDGRRRGMAKGMRWEDQYRYVSAITYMMCDRYEFMVILPTAFSIGTRKVLRSSKSPLWMFERDLSRGGGAETPSGGHLEVLCQPCNPYGVLGPGVTALSVSMPFSHDIAGLADNCQCLRGPRQQAPASDS